MFEGPEVFLDVRVDVDPHVGEVAHDPSLTISDRTKQNAFPGHHKVSALQTERVDLHPGRDVRTTKEGRRDGVMIGEKGRLVCGFLDVLSRMAADVVVKVHLVLFDLVAAADDRTHPARRLWVLERAAHDGHKQVDVLVHHKLLVELYVWIIENCFRLGHEPLFCVLYLLGHHRRNVRGLFAQNARVLGAQRGFVEREREKGRVRKGETEREERRYSRSWRWLEGDGANGA